MPKYARRRLVGLIVSAALAVLAVGAHHLWPDLLMLPSGMSAFLLAAYVLAVLALSDLITLLTLWSLRRRQKPAAEGQMLGSLYRLVAVLTVLLVIGYGFGQLGAVSQFFTLFGGMILGWSLQAPVSGFAAWALVSIKRPFRPGDRVQFPNLGLTGDVQEVGLMYTVLNQVGGSISSEEAVGRFILVPNAMLFSQVAINYTVTQEAAFMLDEVVVRITYDSDWDTAERIMLNAARQVTADVIEATGEEPYIRSDLYDYGVYLRLRYKTRVKRRAETAYQINRAIFKAIQRTPNIDLAIPYVYSYRSGAELRGEGHGREAEVVQQIPVEKIEAMGVPLDTQDIEQVAKSIAQHGLLQPILVAQKPGEDAYEVVAGHLRFAACTRLGWTTIPAEVQRSAAAKDEEHGGDAN
ncbi:MAG: ParB N-terminal domain-containing protein [Anaerolineae bacterium]